MSRQDVQTAAILAAQMKAAAADQVLRSLGGTGVAAVFDGAVSGTDSQLRPRLCEALHLAWIPTPSGWASGRSAET